ncbi:Protein of unknown function [Sanguibacter gelidistatuariae]|uniref:DUF3180 domain-containing protein n=1 Tax=Sanguibacter gelidistatuariae TaxID=1814289 RepID=A0A1G6HT09_9MICO|nr:DUF3180 domain-containing protein [Sanguibacter gelidistatuariae]SDB97437.1 Protein of unknown function [Sanguibacter gelidistatuariae]
MSRTKISLLALVAGVSVVLTWGILLVLERQGTHLGAVPWVVGPVLVVLAVVVLWMALAVRAYQRGRRPSLDALRAARTAALAKAAALTGALLVGWYGGQLLLTLGRLQFESQQSRALAAGTATLCAIVLSVVGVIAERFCQLPPPSEGTPARLGDGDSRG